MYVSWENNISGCTAGLYEAKYGTKIEKSQQLIWFLVRVGRADSNQLSLVFVIFLADALAAILWRTFVRFRRKDVWYKS